MTDILCKWLNDELKLSKQTDPATLARDFCTGYLVGEVLSKHQLQDDFDQFSQNKTADSKLNNFTRLEPTLHLLGIPFDTNIARDIMTEKQGVATRLLYQLFIALNNKTKSGLTGVAMETMRPAAPVKLEAIESGIYKERLKHLTPRQTDLNLEALVDRFHKKQLEMEKTAFKERFLEQERIREWQQDQRRQLLDQSKQARAKQSEVMAKIQAATVHIPKPPPSKTAEAISLRQQMNKQKEALATQNAIAAFEERMKMTLPPSKPFGDEDSSLAQAEEDKEEEAPEETLNIIKPQSNSEYINKIRKRLQEDASARQEREKRRRKVLVDQLKAHEAQEEAHREEMLVNRLMRQSQQERRIAVQLLQARHEKEVIRKNRLTREAQYQERRLKDFEDALNREAEMARLAKLEYIEQTRADRELHDKIMAERAEARYRKHYEMCSEVLSQVVDFSTKIGEYRELTNRLLPNKLMREWTSLFLSGKPLYEVKTSQDSTSLEPTPEQVLEEERLALLDEGDFMEYKNMIGEWCPPEGSEITGPPRNNPIVGHIVQRLFNMVHPPSPVQEKPPPPPPPEFPPFPVKACVLGKVFSGKTTVIDKLATAHRLRVLNVDNLVAEAIEANKSGEVEIKEPVTEAETKPNETEAPPSKEPAAQQPPAEGTPAPEVVDSNKQEENAAPPETVDDEKKDEGTEKGDPEKPVPEKSDLGPDTESISSKSSRRVSKTKIAPKPQPTERAKLGAKAMKCLKKGKPVDDQIIIDVLVDSIRHIPEGTGWVLDGFPTNYTQAKLLEKALSGFDAMAKEQEKLGLGKKGQKKSMLAPDPRPPPPPAEPQSGVNVVIVFDLPDEVVLKRSAGRTYAMQGDEHYHQEFKPPPEGSATGVGKQEQVIPVEDPAHDQEQVQHRITAFLDAWPKLEKWYSKFGSLKKVDATQDTEAVFLEVEAVMEETVNKLLGIGQESEPVPEPETQPEPEKPPEEPKPEPPPEPRPESGSSTKSKRSRSGSKKGSRAGSAKGKSKSPKSGKGREKSESPKRSASKDKKSGKGSRGSSGSPKRGRSGKKTKTPTPEPEPEPEVPQGPPPPEPGSEEWEYVDTALDMELAKILAPHWETVEESYVANNKHTFRKIREEREMIYRYFYQIRQDFQAYLKRPDHKKEFVAQWQKDYNEVPDDTRDDEETRSELHQRVDDLRERLWSICDERKDNAEKERTDIINDGWLEDRLGILSNDYITLMQCEVDRYQDTIRLLKDYYRGMEAPIPDPQNYEFARIPLVELPVTDIPGSPAKSPVSDMGLPDEALKAKESKSSTPSGKRPGSSGKRPGSSGKRPGSSGKRPGSSGKNTPSGKKKGKKSQEPPEEPTLPGQDEEPLKEIKTSIPLVPRRPVSPDPNAPTTPATKEKKDKKGGGKKDKTPAAEEKVESPMPPADPDEKLIFDAFNNGVAAVSGILSAEEAAREAEEQAELEKELEKQREKEKATSDKKGGKGGKKGKSRSPSPKKGKGKGKEPELPPTPTPVEEESEEEKEKKRLKQKMKDEYFFAIREEEAAVKKRVELIKLHAAGVLQDLKNKADNAYKDMNDWLGARFLKEMESIDQCSEVMRHAIESGQKLTTEIEIFQDEFVVVEDIKTVRTPSPPVRPEPMEQPQPDQFTVAQTNTLYNQFMSIAPTGFISTKAFVDMLHDFTTLSYGTESLPDMWTNVSLHQLTEMAAELSPDAEYIDWRNFMLEAAQPWPQPTQTQLLDTLAKYKQMDQKNSGFVTREQFEWVNLWFTQEPPPITPADPAAPKAYDRVGNLKKVLFDIFADHTMEPPQLDYVSMLMYFSVDPDPLEGFLRALSVASGTHMPRPHLKHRGTLSLTDSTGDLSSLDTVKIPDDIPESANEATVPIEALYKVFHHGERPKGDSHRFSVTVDPEDALSMERLSAVYAELEQGEEGAPIPYITLIEHPFIQDVLATHRRFKTPHVKNILVNPPAENIETTSIKTTE
ncbi:sperm flagellar protein 2 isoform X2 [Lingula anatina]|uniref:Sperm flagellar protein 2 isoform X2 n=1 Tax=Lingula anatina TaxID=7574 RepID=A0A1S3JFE2_LINAN|nr:sperm flagellar protein 2 isoform X2 [Lingula anatina]|eukprot:XP_013409132.1 sperm flagellar protein 2 isoform X2 [Lingula anatina]